MNAIIIIPALNPDEILRDIVEKNWKLNSQTIVVDDGSEERCAGLFEELSEKCIVLHHRENRGKGEAIRTALRFIKEELWEYDVIGIMDADGQHRPEDMEKILEVSAVHPEALVIGCRVIDDDIPWPSKIGNVITRKVFRLVTGTGVSDTQTGLRAFSVGLSEFMSEIPGERYEYEMNVLVTCAKRKIPIIEVPVQTIYHDRNNSCSHFRKIRDSIRIYRQLLKFSFVSFSSFLLYYGLFILFTLLFPRTSGYITAANVMARIISGAYNYTMNCRLVFHKKESVKTAADYLALAAGILFLNSILLHGFMIYPGMPVYLAKIFTECILFIISWMIQKKFIFKEKRNFSIRIKTKSGGRV